jgi:hypothetical protein
VGGMDILFRDVLRPFSMGPTMRDQDAHGRCDQPRISRRRLTDSPIVGTM